jgi:hypothetical protein
LTWVKNENFVWLSKLKDVDPFGQTDFTPMLSRFKLDCMTYGMNGMPNKADVLIDTEQGQCQQIQGKEVSAVEQVEEIRQSDGQEVDDELECM